MTVAVAAAVAALAFSGGGYALGVRAPVGIAVWWAVGVAVALGIWPRARLSRTALAALAALVGLALLAGASAFWGQSAEAALDEAGRNGLYAGVLALVLLAAQAGSAARWADGLAAGISAVGLAALASRLFPGLGLGGAASQFFAGDVYLSYPVDYWNGLAALVALAVPLLLRAALDASAPLARALAVAPLPALAGVLYLTSSRGGMLIAVIATGAFVLLAGDRGRALLAAALTVAGAAAAVAVLGAREHLVDGPFETAAAVTEGRSAALLIAVVCLATACAWSALAPLRLRLPRPAVRRAAAALLLVAGAVAADPVARFDAFRTPPPDPFTQPATPGADLGTGGHLLSGEGNGRWQFWQAAVDQFADAPLLGHGAGSYEAWWAQHGSISYFTRRAHSLYLETLGELGLAGLLLVAGLVGAVAAAATGRLRAASGSDRTTLAALAAVALGFAVAAGIDWMWEVPVLAIAGIVACALLLGPATARHAAVPRHTAVRAAVPAAAAVAVAALALPWLAEREVRDSRRAALAGDPATAAASARAAARLAPWAASPRLQHALALEAGGDLRGAGHQIAAAIARDPADWRLRVVDARIARAAGQDAAATAATARARALNPRSRIFKDLAR